MKAFELEKGYFVVTGGLGFLGKKHCEAICEYGGTPIILDICCEGAEEFNNYLYKKYKKKSVFFDIDIGCEESIKKIISKCQNLSQPIFGLVNNAARNPQVGRDGLENSQRLESFSLDVWEKDIRVGLTGAFLCTKYFGSLMNRSQGGVIVNISSDLGLIAPNQEIYKNELKGNDNQPVKPVTYSVIKSGIIGLTRYTATYWPTKVRCNCLCPGGIENGQNKSFIEKVSKLIPMGRLAKHEEYKSALIFMLSNASSYMNGAIISIDGGRTVW